MEDEEDANATLPVSSSLWDLRETVADVHISEDLGEVEREQLQALLLEFQDIFSDRPGVTNVI